MKIIKVGDSSLSYKENFLGDNYLIDTLYAIDELFSNIDLKRPPGNFIRNKNNYSQQALWFGPKAYKYGKYNILDSEDMPDFVVDLARIIEGELCLEDGFLNSVYINRYDNAGIGKHHDNDLIFKEDKTWNGGKEIIVAVFSIGKDSTISIFNGFNGPKIAELNAKDNSLYVMNKNFQNIYYHEVGKSNGIRFSFTFRHCV